MAEQTAAAGGHDWRDRVLTDPDMILDDRDLMRALMAANDRQMGGNVVDMRGLAMARLEARLDRLEDTHRSVIAAAYENLAGTNQIHRCVLHLLEADDLTGLLDTLTDHLADIVRVDVVRLVLEGDETPASPHPAIAMVEAGFVDRYLASGRDTPPRQVTLRPCASASDRVFVGDATRTLSEALLRLDLGEGRPGAMLAFGSENPDQFRASQGTELLTFFAAAFESVLRRHLA